MDFTVPSSTVPFTVTRSAAASEGRSRSRALKRYIGRFLSGSVGGLDGRHLPAAVECGGRGLAQSRHQEEGLVADGQPVGPQRRILRRFARDPQLDAAVGVGAKAVAEVPDGAASAASVEKALRRGGVG